EEITDIVQLADGGILMLGNTSSYGQGSRDVMVLRIDESGILQSFSTYGGIGGDGGDKILAESDSTYILVAGTSSFGDGDNSIWLLNVDSNGDTLTTKVLDGFYAEPIIRSGCTATDGYLIVGHWHAVEGVNPAIFALKINADGDTLWCRQYRIEDVSVQAADVVATDDGGFAILGIIPNEEQMDNDTWLIRTDATGDTLWTKSYSLAPKSLGVTAGGDFIIGGSGGAAMEGDQPALMKVDTTGVELWTTTYGVMWEYSLYDHLVDSRDEIVMLGSWNNDLWIAKTGGQGQTIWDEYYDGKIHGQGICVIENEAGNYIAAGNRNIGGSDYQGWVMEVGYHEYPLITHLADVPDDEGRRLEINWAPSCLDISREVSGYWIYVTDTENGWHRMEWVAAIGQEPLYTHEVSTFGDSAAHLVVMSRVKVEALMEDQSPSYYSPVDSAYSIDNLAPPTPDGLTATAKPTKPEIVLSWLSLDTPDLRHVAIYHGTTSGFEPDLEAPTAIVLMPDTSVVISGLTAPAQYYFRVAAVDTNGNWSDFSVEVTAILVGIEDAQGVPTAFALHPAYPNPFNPVSMIRYELPHTTNVTLIVYDIRGREVVRLVDGYMEPGYRQVVWDGKTTGGLELPSGIYIARLATPGYSKAIKMVLLK
ncbi:T9SS type A sorting domain-containing protein, partial [Candidatus Neomarinimicrobiota bacterium]